MTSDNCRKVRYPGENEARNALRKIHRFARAIRCGRSRRKECRAYYCKHCRGWHLTSQRNA